MIRHRCFAIVLSAAVATGSSAVYAQVGDGLGTVRLPVAVKADGQPLPAGTYALRLSAEAVRAVVGQGPGSAKWVEFVQAGQVKGRELASVVPPDKVKAVAKGSPPPAGRPAVHALRGDQYLRVWINLGGSQYFVHLAR